MKPSLVIMAAGMGSRYGGLKQIDSVGPAGERIIDYSLFDAARAGFGRVVFIIRRDIEAAFRGAIEPGLPGDLPISYAYQELDDLPDGFRVPEGRTKPWGTGQAVLSCRDIVKEPFGVINADDFYGRDAFEKLADGLVECLADGTRNVLVAYRLANTLSAFGAVSRGVCSVSGDGRLRDIVERTRIGWVDGEILCEEDDRTEQLGGETMVSMNMWGFGPGLFPRLDAAFRAFLDERGCELKSEFFIPSAIDAMIKDQQADVKVSATTSRWMGMTYPDDRDAVREGIASLVERGEYPSPLWG